MLNYGPKRLISPAVLRMRELFMRSIYAKITFRRQTSQCLKGNNWTEGQCHVAQTRLHKIQHRSFLIPHSQILNSLPSLLSPQKNLHVQPPRRTYGKLPVSSSSIQTPLSVLEDGPWTSSQICAVKFTPTIASMFAVEDITCPLALSASDGEFRCINCPNPSSKPRARNSLLRELNLATVSQFTPREKLLYDRIRKKESALCKLRRKCRRNLKFVSDMEANTVMEDIQHLWMQRVSGYWRVFLGIVSVSQRAEGGTLKTKRWLCPFLNAAQNPTPSCDYCFPFHLDARCNPYSVPFTLQQASMPMCLVHPALSAENVW